MVDLADKGKFLGYMLVGKRPCGRLMAMSWEDPNTDKSNKKAVMDWLRRGLTVERLARFEHDPQPQSACDESTKANGLCACLNAKRGAK